MSLPTHTPPGGDNEPGDQTKPDDKDSSKGEEKSGEIPNIKSGRSGGEPPKTATAHPQGMLFGLLLALTGMGILAFRRRFA